MLCSVDAWTLRLVLPRSRREQNDDDPSGTSNFLNETSRGKEVVIGENTRCYLFPDVR